MEERETGIQKPQKSSLENIMLETQGLKATEAGWSRTIKDRLNRVFHRQEKPKELFPKMSMDIYYSEHLYPESWYGLKDRLKKCDIYVPEQHGVTLGGQEFLNNVSFGRISPKEAEEKGLDGESYPSWFEFLRNIHNSRKPIITADIPRDHRIYKKTEALHARYRYLLETNLPIMNFTDVLKEIKILGRNNARLEKQREEYMLSHLTPYIQKVLEDYPQLKEKDELKVLLSLGGYHTSFYHALKKGGQDINREFSVMPFVYSYFTEGMRRFSFGRDVDDELAARIFLESVFQGGLRNNLSRVLQTNSPKSEAFVRKVISQFSLRDAKEIFEKGNIKSKEVFVKRSGVLDLFIDKFIEKGITLPKSAQELDEFLAKPLPRLDTMQE